MKERLYCLKPLLWAVREQDYSELRMDTPLPLSTECQRKLREFLGEYERSRPKTSQEPTLIGSHIVYIRVWREDEAAVARRILGLVKQPGSVVPVSFPGDEPAQTDVEELRRISSGQYDLV